ncbi:MAG: cell division protein FtsX [Sandaracinaceae bacterium]
MTRAARAMREDATLHLVSLSSLTVAFLCLASALAVVSNLTSMAQAFGRSGRMSIYLAEGADAESVAQLRLLLEGISEVQSVEHVTSAEARERFMEDASIDGSLAELPTDAFPASLEVTLASGATSARVGAIVTRIRALGAVDEVETYEGWFARLDTLLGAAKLAAFGLALLVLLSVLFVVANTIRLAIAGRRTEIEVLKLCGASDGFVRGPFVIEGAAQGFLSAAAALLILFLAFAMLRGHVDSSLAALAGVRTVFLEPSWAFVLVVGGGLIGALGSLLSLRRYLVV